MAPTMSSIFITLLTMTSTALAAPSEPLQKRYDLACNDNGGGYRPVSEAQTCVNRLYGIGDTECNIEGENIIFCTEGDTAIYGANVSGGSVTSLCKHVARAAQKIIDSCTTSEGYVGGSDAAYGNAGIIVSINYNTGV
ncbi:hypothetical protein BJX99DRAFT_259403 [Aspergillus californicus]